MNLVRRVSFLPLADALSRPPDLLDSTFGSEGLEDAVQNWAKKRGDASATARVIPFHRFREEEGMP